MKQAIVGQNKKLLKPEAGQDQDNCNCRPRDSCPLQNKCLETNIIYQATVTESIYQEPPKVETYAGLCSTTFKKRYTGHRFTFAHLKAASETTLSTHIWDLKNRGASFNIKWKILDRGQPFNPATRTCQLCTKEKFYILFKPELTTLNSRNELGAHCRHKKTSLVGTKKFISARGQGSG
jgi:hypothetical protein